MTDIPTCMSYPLLFYGSRRAAATDTGHCPRSPRLASENCLRLKMSSTSLSTSRAGVAVDGDRLWVTMHTLAEINFGTGGGVAGVALTDVDKAGRDQFIEW